MPQVSVIVIFLNAERFLAEAVQSVLNQSFSDWELILADDGSTDRSTAIALDFASQDNRIRYVEHPGHENRGMSATRNLGAANSSAPYVAFLDSDDVWEIDKLAEQVGILERMPHVAMVSGAVLHWFSWDEAAIAPDRTARPGGYANRLFRAPEAALALNPLTRGTDAVAEVLVRRSAFNDVGGFEERFRGLYEDQAFYVKIYLRFNVFISDSTWLRYRMHDDSHCGQLRKANRIHTWRRRMEFFDWLTELNRAGWFKDRRVTMKLWVRKGELRLAIAASPIVQAAERVSHARDLLSRRYRRAADRGLESSETI